VCPRCGVDRTGSEVEPQRWFVAIGVPVVPLATLPNEMWCNTCSHQSDLGVLDVPTTAQLTGRLELAVRSSIAAVVRAGAVPAVEPIIDGAVIDMAFQVMNADGHRYDEDCLRQDVRQLDDDRVKVNLGRLADELTSHGKQMFLRRATAVAVSDGPLDDLQREVLIDIGLALSMPRPHIYGVLAVASLDQEVA
jgi:hypothetical protein